VLTNERFQNAVTLAKSYMHVDDCGKLAAEGEKTGADVMDFINQAQLTMRRSESAVRWLARAPVEWTEILALAAASAVVLGIGGYVAIHYRDQIGATWPAFSAAVAESLTLVGLVTTWAKKHLSTVSRGLDEVDALRTELDHKLEETRAAHMKGVEAAEQEAARASAALKDAEATLAAADAEVQRAENQVKEAGSLNRIAKLVEQRITGRDYEQYLGIIDAIRKDFQTLTTLMKDMRGQTQPAIDGQLPIDRIVLYIDDLDRCPSEQVVAVLEAIHLLLGFELFVVVVGVDSRWLLHSLQTHMAQFRNQDNGGNGDDSIDRALWESNPMNYLEKIFQVPFTLQAMQSGGFGHLIDDLTRPTDSRAAEKSSVKENEELRKAEETVSAGGGETPQEVSPADVPQSGPAAASQPSSPAPPAAAAKTAALPAESPHLSFQQYEIDWMKALYPLMPSPRGAKRFVNLYRVMRGIMDDYEFHVYIQEKTGEYDAALLLLAMLIGYPEETTDVFQELRSEKPGSTWWTFIRNLAQARIANEKLEPTARARWAMLDAKLEEIQKTGKPELTRSCEHFIKWAPKVARFSFYSGRIIGDYAALRKPALVEPSASAPPVAASPKVAQLRP